MTPPNPSRLAAALLGATLAFAVHAQDTSTATAAEQAAPAPVDGERALPLWELGLAGFAGSFENYPASGSNRLTGLPAPYAVYRGRVLRSDREGLRMQAVKASRVEIDVSVGASLSSRSDDDGARAGMPDLDYLFEAGPNLRVILLTTEDRSRLTLNLPVRAVASTNFSSRFDGRGFLFAPRLAWRDRRLFGSEWQGNASIGPDFATERLQEYFYEVQPQYARPGRPAYDADAGYLGTRLDLGVSRALTPRVRLFLGTSFSLYSGAANADSPLFKEDTGFGVFAGFTWSIWQSKQTVQSAE